METNIGVDLSVEPPPPVKKRSAQPKTCMGCSVPLCNICMVCHTDGCKYTELAVYNAATAAKYRHLEAKTQKARGFVSLDKQSKLPVPSPYYLILNEDDIEPSVEAAVANGITTLFVRPCPVRARHGFEESRSVKFNPELGKYSAGYADELVRVTNEVKAIFKAANEADEEHAAELILLPFVGAKFNAIITPSRMAVGPNHDGATAGYDSISIPLMGTQFSEDASYGLVANAGVGAGEDPYVEVVVNPRFNAMFTQVRSGVRVPAAVGADYLPAPMRVVEVIDAEGDLLEWEKQVKTIKPGTVVVKLGGTLISHYGVHCLYNKVPCFTSRRPSVGELLDVVSVSPTPSPEAVIKGLAYGALVPITLKDNGSLNEQDIKSGVIPVNTALIAMMTSLHNAGAMSGEHGFWLGFSAAFMMRAGMAGSHGEARHKLQDLQSMRNFVYKLAFKDFMGSRNTLGTAQWMFTNLKWSSSFGGPAWAKCTQSIIDLDSAIVTLINNPSNDAVALVVSKLNNAVNQAHNGGWWLNKFIQHSWFDLASRQSLRSLAISAAAMYQVKKTDIEEARIEEFLSSWKSAKPIEAVAGGKLHVQLNSKNVDQTVYDATLVPIKSPSAVMLNSQELYGELSTYVGAMCPACLTKFDFFKSADEISVGQVCGSTKSSSTPCTGVIGWAADGEVIWKTHSAGSKSNGDPGPDDDDSSDDDYDSGDSDYDSSETESVDTDVPFEVPPNTVVDKSVESWPPLKMKGAPVKLQNINGLESFEGSISEAQCTFSLSAATGKPHLIHVQYKSDKNPSDFYFSAAMHGFTNGLTEAQIAKILQGQTDPKVSWSGSMIANYWKLTPAGEVAVINDEVTEVYFSLVQPELNLTLLVYPKKSVVKIG